MAQCSRHRNVLQWMRDQVQPVPLDMALCEFDCCKTTCTNREWSTCQSRIAFTASGKHVYPTGLFTKTRRHWYVPEPAASYPKLPVPVYASILG